MPQGRSALGIVRQHFPSVKRVNDADENTMVEVTGRDIASAKRRDHEVCAMAVACKRARGLDGVIISLKTAYLIKGNTATRYILPESVSREVIAFDRDGGFAPGKYQMLAPAPGRKLGAHAGGTNKHSNGNGASVKYHVTTGIRTVLGSKEGR